MELGIIGHPESGKTTVFNALTRGRAEAALSGGQSSILNIGVSKVPDQRLEGRNYPVKDGDVITFLFDV